ncbi:MAG: hypothetical protein ABIE22_05660 [archaeon]
MKPEELELRKLREPLENSLKAYASLLDKEIAFQDFPDFHLTPNKPNSARTLIPVSYAGTEVGGMYAIVFIQGDGTGDENTYKLGDVIIPQELGYEDKPERIIPRAKSGVVAEGFFPFFSMNKNGYAAPFAAHLDELILGDSRRIRPVWRLGQNKSAYLQAIHSGLEIIPKVQFTTMTQENGERFGDPHAIHYGKELYDSIQVVGFLSIKDPSNPLLDSASKWEKPSEYEK